MKANRKVVSVDEIMDVRFGKVGTPKRNLFREKAKNLLKLRVYYNLITSYSLSIIFLILSETAL